MWTGLNRAKPLERNGSMGLTVKRRTMKLVYSTTLLLLAFVALLLPIVTPGLNPGLVGVHANHGHLVVDGVVEPHSHDLTEAGNNDVIFTTDDSGSAGASLIIITPSNEQASPSGERLTEPTPVDASSDQWRPKSPLTPPRLSA